MFEEGEARRAPKSGLAEATDAMLREVEKLERVVGIPPAKRPLRDPLDPTPRNGKSIQELHEEGP